MVGVLCILITILFSINTFVLAQPDGGLAFFFFFFLHLPALRPELPVDLFIYYRGSTVFNKNFKYASI